LHHTWADRFHLSLKNRNWKKIVAHEGIEYSWLGAWITVLEGKPESWIIGLGGAFIIHMIVFEAVDSLHNKSTRLPRWAKWFFDHDHHHTKTQSK